MTLRYPHAFLALAIIPLFTGSLSQLAPILSTPPELRVLLFLGGALLLFTRQYTRRAPGSVVTPLGLFAVFGIFSLLWTFDVSITLQRALLNAATVLGLYVYSRKTTTSNQLSVIVLSCFVALLVVCVGALPAYYLDAPEAYVQGNFRGYFGNSNSLGHYISSAALPLCLFWFFSATRWKTIVALVGLAVLFFLLLEARSRGAFVSAFVSGTVLYFGLTRFSTLNKTAIIAPILAVIPLIYFAGFALQKYENDAEAFSTRSDLWALHITAISEKPVLGWGIGVNPVNFKVYVDESYNYLAESEKGSSYYVLPEELGIPLSAAIFISLMPFFLKQVPQTFFHIKKDGKPHMGLLPLSIIIGGLVHGIFESWFFSFGNPMAIIFWLSCIYVSSLHRDQTKAKTPLPNK